MRRGPMADGAILRRSSLNGNGPRKSDLNGRVANPDDGRDKVYRVIFVSLLADLLAFTMILPLLPSLLDYYRQNDTGGLFPYLQSKVLSFQRLVGAPAEFNTVLFGGLLGSVYSFLQFLVSPVIGALSDVYGRKPLLLLCMSGEVLAYLIWAMSTNFTIFAIARIVGGIANGNVSLCTAIVTDVSSTKTRGRGMAMIGIAFSIGFIVGPITGAAFSRWARIYNPSQFYIVPAVLAAGLAIGNVVYLALCFPETLPREKRAKSIGSGLSRVASLISPRALFSFRAVQNLSKADLSSLQRFGLVYFLYLLLYSGLEYTLTFLTHLKFEYTSFEQGKMFLFIGATMAAVQGGYVRRVGAGKECKTAVMGLAVIIPSFLLVGLAPNLLMFYLGLLLYSLASASVVPSLSTLVSVFGSYSQKGTVMGIFRSIGALARALGPILASTVFWSLGYTVLYVAGGFLLLLPLVLLRREQR